VLRPRCVERRGTAAPVRCGGSEPRPDLLVCLGTTAARSVFGQAVPILKQRGQVLDTPLGPPALITLHPSALLRIRDREEAHLAFEQLVDDLRKVAQTLRRGTQTARSRP
jgi:uracil-DNA glycosylase